MYVRTENDEIIEFFDRHHPEPKEIREDYKELYEKLYGEVCVKPVNGEPSWQLIAIRMNDDREVCIATFDTVKQANLALKAFCRDREKLNGWDAVEYKNRLNTDQSVYDLHNYEFSDDDKIVSYDRFIRAESGESLNIYRSYRNVHEMKGSYDWYSEYYGRPYTKPVDGTSSWQLLSARLDDEGEEICIATFNTLKEASDALDSLDEALLYKGGWDAIEYKRPYIDIVKRHGSQHLIELLGKSVEDLKLSVLPTIYLKKANIKTIRELITNTEKDLLEDTEFFRGNLEEIVDQLANIGLSLGMNLNYMDSDPDIAEEYTGPDVLSH